MKFTDKLVAFITVCVIAAVSLVVLGGSLSFRQLAFKHQEIKVGAVIEVIDKQFNSLSGGPEFAAWLPNLLTAHSIISLELANDKEVVYSYRSANNLEPQELLISYKYHLQSKPGFFVKVDVERPFKQLQYSMDSMFGLSAGIFTVVFGLVFSIRWLKQQFIGAEQLEKRAQAILVGKVKQNAYGSDREWPPSASQAFDYLIHQLQDAQQERSRFDTYIRSNAFIDEKTGLGNRLAFENRLEVALQDESVAAGAVLLLDLVELEELSHQYGASQGDEIIVEASEILRSFCGRFPGAFYARYAGAQFAILIPQMSMKEIEDLANQLCKVLFKLHLPDTERLDNFFYVGVTNYRLGDEPMEVMDEVDKASRAAQLQGPSGWFMFDKDGPMPDIAKGTIRWRALLQGVLDKRALMVYMQPAFDGVDGRETHIELLARIFDENGKLLPAGVFFPMAEKVGLTSAIDKEMTEKALSLLRRRGELSVPICLNLTATTLIDQDFRIWLRYELMQIPKKLLDNLIIEISESQVSRYKEQLLGPMAALKKLGCRLAVDHAGQDVVSTQYIKEFNIDLLKLHPSLVRDIQSRQVNQLAIRSLLGGCGDTNAKVVAVGVEKQEEWLFLQQLGIYAGQGHFFASPQKLS